MRDGVDQASTTRVVIVDDEAPARSRLRALLDRPGTVCVGEADSVSSAVAAIREHTPDLVFLDIQLADGSGFEVLEATLPEDRPVIVFVTAYDSHALRAFDVQALDYLLKPFDDRRFERALARATETVRRRRIEGLCGQLGAVLASGTDARHETPTAPAKLAVRANGRTRLVAIEDIDWIEAAGAYVRLHTGDRSLLLRQPLGELEKRLARHRFLRIHRSTLVQADRVSEVHSATHGDGRVVLEDGTSLRLSRSHRDRLERLIG